MIRAELGFQNLLSVIIAPKTWRKLVLYLFIYFDLYLLELYNEMQIKLLFLLKLLFLSQI